jgi:hypothetical protein
LAGKIAERMSRSRPDISMLTGTARAAVFFLTIVQAFLTGTAQSSPPLSSSASGRTGYFGFDRNDYPGDSNLKILRQSFSYTGYWLNTPPGAKTNSWKGKRRAIQEAGFGFLVLFNGRTYAQIKSHGDAAKLGASDGAAAIAAARADGFPPQTVIFLDQEQGGRLLPDQRAYLHAWIDAVNAATFVAGVYCSGIPAKEAAGVSVITAADIRQNAGNRKIKYWVVNDSCPPSPGCSATSKNLLPESNGINFSEVWQYAQSPKRSDFARNCPANYNTDGNCYPPGVLETERLHVDLNVATSSDPSNARTPQ